MLARSELAGIARRDGVPLGVVERDYVQHLLLRQIARAPLAFKGGTCLRIAHGSARYSEDLDFDAAGGTEEVDAKAADGRGGQREQCPDGRGEAPAGLSASSASRQRPHREASGGCQL